MAMAMAPCLIWGQRAVGPQLQQLLGIGQVACRHAPRRSVIYTNVYV